MRSRPLGEGIANSFAVEDTGAVYIVTDRAMYRLEAGATGLPEVVWRQAYENSGVQKPGQSSAGSGTTPTFMGDGLVAITDNADPMNVLVYRRGSGRRICRLLGGRRARVRVLGGRTRLVRRADFYRGRKRVARDRWRPFRKVVRVGRGRVRTRARIMLNDGRRVVRTRRVGRARSGSTAH